MPKQDTITIHTTDLTRLIEKIRDAKYIGELKITDTGTTITARDTDDFKVCEIGKTQTV